MSEINDGGPAFPRPQAETSQGGNYEQDGMSLRDWFAGQALAGLCANPGGPFQANGMTGWGIVNCDSSYVANWCSELADAMLAARKAGQS